jgi:hypothetical protein
MSMDEPAKTDFSHDDLTLDANAFAGLLEEIFGRDMTAVTSECANCANRAPLGSLRAYVGLGVVLRCSVCGQVVARIAPMAGGGHRVDMRGAAYVEL